MAVDVRYASTRCLQHQELACPVCYGLPQRDPGDETPERGIRATTHGGGKTYPDSLERAKMAREGYTPPKTDAEALAYQRSFQPPLPTDDKLRKETPLARGLLDYFPHALFEVAQVSFISNKKHNGDAPVHWSRHNASDHPDCIIRHLTERGTRDGKTRIRHTAYLAWRALALLQEEIEAEAKKS